MNTETEGIFAVLAALIVLFSTMWNLLVSVAVSIRICPNILLKAASSPPRTAARAILG